MSDHLIKPWTTSIAGVVFLCLPAYVYASQIDKIEEDSKALEAKTRLEGDKALVRWAHAKELLGSRYSKSVVKEGETVSNLDEFLIQWTKRSLRGQWKTFAPAVANTIIEESEKYKFDPIFVLAIIQSESSFNPVVVGTSGEVGLMQVTPKTAHWISNKYDLPWKGVKSLKDPCTNIKIGSAYLAHLREEFDGHSQLYLAAYNMGSGNVQKALGRQIWPKDYPNRVMRRYFKYYVDLKEWSRKAIEESSNPSLLPLLEMLRGPSSVSRPFWSY